MIQQKYWLILFSIVFLIGCNTGSLPQPQADPTSTSPEPAPIAVEEDTIITDRFLRISTQASDAGTFDPHLAAGGQDRVVVDMIFNGLLRYQPGNAPTIEPDLAKAIPAPELVAGQQVWTFELRQGVMCQPGPQTEAYELTADDVVYSLRKSANAERSAYSGEYVDFQVEKVDTYTVRITLTQPTSTILFFPKVADYSGGFIVCQRAVEAMGDAAFAQHPVGTGPFQFESYDAEAGEAVLTAHDDYFRGSPLLAGVRLLYQTDPTVSWDTLFVDGLVDINVGSSNTTLLSDIPGAQLDINRVGNIGVIHFNTTYPPLDVSEVRQAMAYALDRNALGDAASNAFIFPIFSPVPADLLPGGLNEAEAEALQLDYARDLERARQLLAEAGYADGFTLEVVTSDFGDYLRLYQSLAAQWAELGIDLQIEVVDHGTMHQLIRENRNAVVVYLAWRPNADVILTRFFHSDSIVVTGEQPDTNFSHYDQIDEIIETARAETNPNAQIEFWKLAQVQILTDMVAYPFYHDNFVSIRQPYVILGHEVIATLPTYPQITEQTFLMQ